MNWNRTTPTENPEPGSYIARCVSIVDLGTHQHAFGSEVWSSRDVRIGFELPTEKMKGTYNEKLKGLPFVTSITLKQSLHPSSKMRKMLKSWRGRDFTKEEVATFDPKKMLGVPCRVTLVESSDGQYVNIDSLAPLSKNEKCLKQINPSTFFSLEPGEFNADALKKLGEKTREKIMASPEYKALTSGASDGAQDDSPPESDEVPPTTTDDDIPF